MMDEQAPTADETRAGFEIITDYVKTLPGKPGVYRMFDMKGNVLYVGKARNLKARVSRIHNVGTRTISAKVGHRDKGPIASTI